MKIFALLSLMLVPLCANAAIYRWVDSEGVLHFSDQKPNRPDVEEVEVKPANIVPTDPAQSSGAANPAAGGTAKSPSAKVPPRYRSLQIVSPGNDEAVRANDGVVTVRCTLQPALGVAAGHEIRVVIDGRQITGLKSCGTTLTQLVRGTHSIQVQVVDSLGKVLISSPTHSFHVLKTSRL